MGNALSPAGCFTDSNYFPVTAVAIDGDSNPWVLTTQGVVFKVNPAGQTISVLNGPATSPAKFMAIDSTGTVWAVSSPLAAPAVTRFIGAAAPVVTPLGRNNAYGQRP